MPQLNPAPWFIILMFSWLVFTTIIPSKVLTNIFLNEPSPSTMKKMKTEPWTWPWH